MPDYTIDDLPRSQAEAQRRGFKLYFDGSECRQGHVAPKYASDASCLECQGRSLPDSPYKGE